MDKRIAIAAVGPVGAVFLEWSIYFLSNQNFYFHYNDGILPVVTNPLQNAQLTFKDVPLAADHAGKYLTGLVNAHNHKKNLCYGYNELEMFLDKVDQQSDIGNIVWHQLAELIPSTVKKLHILPDQISDNINLIKTIRNKDWSDSVNQCLDSGYKVIHIAIDQTIPLYFINNRRPEKDVLLFLENKIDNSGDNNIITQDFNRAFFADNSSAWPDNCSRIWDKRERDALNSRPYDTSWRSNINPMFNKTKKHYHINCLTYWFNGESEILKIMEYLELSVDPDRYAQWKLIYAEWQKIQIKFLDFTFKIDDIITGIINNWDYEIGPMTYNEETVIQHLILYKHNLNFNTWQLTKFPTNTKDLHKLLIPCVHTLEKIY